VYATDQQFFYLNFFFTGCQSALPEKTWAI